MNIENNKVRPPAFRRFIAFQLNRAHYCFSVLHAVKVEFTGKLIALPRNISGFAGYKEYDGKLIPALDLKQFYSKGNEVSRGLIGIVTIVEDRNGKEILTFVLIDEIYNVETIYYNSIKQYSGQDKSNALPPHLILGKAAKSDSEYLIVDINKAINDILIKNSTYTELNPINN